jgi:hypothetical protein
MEECGEFRRSSAKQDALARHGEVSGVPAAAIDGKGASPTSGEPL